MVNDLYQIEESLYQRYPGLRGISRDIQKAYEILENCYRNQGKALICGNGGSAADADHIVGELMKGFYYNRPLTKEQKLKFQETQSDWEHLTGNLQQALPAISLCGHTALITAFANDVDAGMVFAQQVYGYGKQEDVLLALSTSGNSKNVVNAVKVAKTLGMESIGITGRNGGAMKELCSLCICVPAEITAQVQEFTLPIYHTLCAMLENTFFVTKENGF